MSKEDKKHEHHDKENKHDKNCECDENCTCGCQEGKECK